MEGWTEDRVRHLLRTAANLPQAQRGYLLGARLGELLRQMAPDFNANVLGDDRLTTLLRRFPDLLTIRPDIGSQDVIIEFHDLGKTNQRHVADRSLLRSNNGASQARTEVLDQLLWKAMVSNRNDVRWFLDLESLMIVEVPLDFEGNIPQESEPARAPERFLTIPAIPQDELREVIHEYVNNLNLPALDLEIDSLLTQTNWFPQVSDRMRELGITSWKLAHRRFVIDRARAWLDEHGVFPDRFIRSTMPHEPLATRPRHAPALVGRVAAPIDGATSISQQDIRELVLRAISKMSEQELLDLRIPLRYLI